MTLPDFTFEHAPCHRPLIRMLVQYDGEVCLCCEDTAAAFELGNVHRQSLGEIWYSERHAGIVQDLIAGRRDRYELCRSCPMSPTGPPPKGERVSFAPRKFQPHQGQGEPAW